MGLRRRTHATSAHIFRLLSRSSAAAYQLLAVRHRWYPYKLFDLLRGDTIVDELADAEPCMLDPYTEDFRIQYTDDLGGSHGKEELQVVAGFADTDTASTERCHSQNQRRLKHRVWTHPTDMASLSSWALSRSHIRQAADMARHREAGGSATGRRGSGVDGDVPEPQEKKQRKGGGGAYRAFLHMKTAGKQWARELMQHMSLEYAALSPEEKAHYEYLGGLGSEVHAAGERTFGPRRQYGRASGLRDSATAGGAGPASAGGRFIHWTTETTKFIYVL